jgi:hypothetical protein
VLLAAKEGVDPPETTKSKMTDVSLVWDAAAEPIPRLICQFVEANTAVPPTKRGYCEKCNSGSMLGPTHLRVYCEARRRNPRPLPYSKLSEMSLPAAHNKSVSSASPVALHAATTCAWPKPTSRSAAANTFGFSPP